MVKPVQPRHEGGRRRFTQIVALASFALWPPLAHTQENLEGVGQSVPTLQTSPVFVGGDTPRSIGFPLPPVSALPSFWANADLLLWHASGTPGNTGILGTALGSRFGAGMWLDPERRFGLEASGLVLGDRSSNAMRFYENGDHQAQPFFNMRLPESGGLGRPVLEGHWPMAGGEHRR
jgi:hypothetical protein